MNEGYNRKHRHRANNRLKNKASVRSHAEIAGRTGMILAKQTPSSKHVEMRVEKPNPPLWFCGC